MIFTRGGVMRLVSRSKTKEWLGRVSFLIVKEVKRYMPDDIITKAKP
jgi:hypothetical protein